MNAASDFYRKLYSDKTKKTDVSNTINESYFKSVDEMKVIEAIESVKLEKNPGSDNNTNESMKIPHTILAGLLVELFNLTQQNSETPSQWSESYHAYIQKTGGPNDIGNYRPISLLPNFYNHFSTVKNKRISSILELQLLVEQAGFRKGFCTVDP
ncbi:Probable RNA-directed DNA polymerase from transposon X-element [Eumeta japonica]|uniref:Probable RNA-directed DNA polymerase from transposon X-element n=1 Tax=Eumeta variegata TaxID=151549 RepID=A0A4C1SPS4_EUMVA|nr:Probable RNA-directed DNA polymerase from transposon X-element [Eumeta japonica]